MEMNKRNIRMSCQVGKTELLITIDDDFIVPDVKPDISRKIKETGDVVVEKIRPMDEKIGVSGHLHYRLFYSTERNCSGMEGDIPFDETVSMLSVSSQDIVRSCSELQDITISVINSRKISVRAVIVVKLIAEKICSKEIVTEPALDNLQSIKKHLNVLQLAIAKKDIFRIRESINLPADRRTAGEVIWYEAEPQSLDIRATDGVLNIKGELSIFCVYSPMDDIDGMSYYQETVPFSGKMDITGYTEDIYPDINATVYEKSMILRPDANGELRIIDVELILDMDIRGYEENEYEIMSDVYSPSYNLETSEEDIDYESFVMKNNVKCKADERFRIPAADNIMQLISTYGRVNVDEMSAVNGGILIEGSVTIDIMYLQQDENEKIGFVRHEIPFSHQAEINGINDNCEFTGTPGILQITAMLTGGNEIDIKCSAEIDIMVLEKHEDRIICEIKANPPDMDYIKNLPGITGYITKNGDTLWKLAKKYCTTIDKIVEQNGLTSEELSPGMKLLIVKTC